MQKIISTGRIPIKMWLDELEPGAYEQAEHLANFPYAFHHVALMPDSHQGYGMPIGGVLATREVIIPNAVGVDIGCGMCAVRTNFSELAEDKLKKIMSGIRKRIPLGFKKHEIKQDEGLLPTLDANYPVIKKEWKNALLSLGSLGGGNHFIEIQRGSDGFIWIMLHSGSRNLGLQVANYYNKQAEVLNEKWGSKVPKAWQLAYLPLEEPLAEDYLREMNFCTEYALANRKLMMERVLESMKEILGEVQTQPLINIAHNYAALETHFGERVWVHRKGATQAKSGQVGIIPGSQGTKSYIVRGKGNPESFESCSHGAGRKMGRKEAQRSLDLKKEQELLNSKHIIHSLWSLKDLDEAPSAYKDIDEVMNFQQDLVEIEVALEPLAVVKG